MTTLARFILTFHPSTTRGVAQAKGTLLAALLLAGCGGDSKSPTSPGGQPPPAPDPLLIEIVSGNGQTARIGSDVATPPTVRVRRTSGAPESGVTVSFSITSGGGQVTGASTTTDASGLARVGSWRLGETPGQNTLGATASGIGTAAFSATARLPFWTVMVYLAADNNLAVQGFIDVEEMELAGWDPEVQVVVQGEFNPGYMLLNGATLDLINLQSWDTFRYTLGNNPLRVGIDGEVTYLGSVDMTRPLTLRNFVNWGRENLPAQRYVLVPWNHGGGYQGLIQDLSNRGSYLMSMAEFRSALEGLEPLDIVDFDMCLMGGFETLQTMQGLADVVVFSEELVPGQGNPYHLIIDRLQANPTASTQDVAAMMVEQYSDLYLNGRFSTTKSAYTLSEFAPLEVAVANLSSVLSNNLASLRSMLVTVLLESQKYTYRELTDIGDFATRLRAVATDADVLSALDAVSAAAADPRFRLAFRNYSAPEDSDVGASTGLHIVFPSGESGDAFDDSGRGSFSAYETEYPNSPWGDFLSAWSAALPTTTTFDFGLGQALELYEVWDVATAESSADVDFWLLEPSQEIFVPWYGTVTPNGFFSGDSYESDPNTYYEGWVSKQVIQRGQYKIYAHLWTGPADQQTDLDVAFRFSASDNFETIYGDNPVRLTFDVPIENDQSPTLDEADVGAYSNFLWVAVFDAGPGTPSLVPPDRSAAKASSLTEDFTSEQLLELLRIQKDRRSRR